MDEGTAISRTWPAEPASVRAVRAFVTEQLDGVLAAPVVAQALVVASELATNAVKHAGGPFTVTVEREGRHVTLRVSDGSTGVPAVVLGDRLSEGGRGLVLVGALSDDWGLVAEPDGGKSVWARFTASA